MDNIFSDVLPDVLRLLDRNAKQEEYFSNPVLWAKDYLGVQLWNKQAEIAMSVVENQNTVVKAGHEVGKSFVAGVLICWWIDTRWRLPGGCFVVSTAPSTKQINAIVWREVRKFFQIANERFAKKIVDHPLPGYITSDAHWRLGNGIELGYGSKPPDAKSDTMSGIHARYVLAVGDEAVGLSEGLIDDLGNITTNATSRAFLICNPTNPLSYVAKIFKNKFKSWARYTITVFDSPNFHGGEGLPIEVLESLVGQSYVDNKLEEWGSEKSPKYIARVMGEFAWDAGPTIISVEDMAVGLDTDLIPSSETVGVLGVDLARYGEDESVAYHYHEGKLRLVDHWSKTSGTDSARKIDRLARDYSVAEVRIDGMGLGGPIADMVVELAGDAYVVVEMIASATSPDRVRWFNSRAFWYDTFAEQLRQGKIDIDPEDEQLQEELLGIEYKFPKAGAQSLLIESKDDMKKRGVGSPDYADAAIYACADISDIYGLQPGDQIAYDEDAGFEDNWYFEGISKAGW